VITRPSLRGEGFRRRAFLVLGTTIALCLGSTPGIHSSGAAAAADPFADIAPPSRCPSGMVRITGGTAELGSMDAAELLHSVPPNPPHRRTFGDFCIDRDEVAIRDYLTCQSCAIASIARRRGSWCPSPPGDRYPVVCINRDDAAAYCLSRNAKLPTGDEWEFAARGTSGRIYPWGDPIARDAGPVGRTMYVPIGTHSEDVTPTGVRGLVTNVGEWTDESSGTMYEHCDVFRGTVDPTVTESGEKYPGSAVYRHVDCTHRGRPLVGFRCAVSLDP